MHRRLRLCRVLGVVDMGEELLAMGDVENGVGMLDSAGVGLAMGNRGEGVKE